MRPLEGSAVAMRIALLACALGAPLLASIQAGKTRAADSPLLASIKVVEENTRSVADSLEAVRGGARTDLDAAFGRSRTEKN